MMDNKIMVLAKVEDLHDDNGNVIGRLVTDKAGNELKVKKGQGGKLEGRWDELDNGVGKAFEFTMKMFKPQGKTESYPFVADFKEVKDELKIQAAQRVAEAMPNEQDTTRTSIEAQVAVKAITELLVAKIPFQKQIYDAYENWLLTRLQGGQDVKTETHKELEIADATEVLEPEGESEVSWESIRPKLGELLNEKSWTIDGFLKKLVELGADKSSKNVKPAFESLDSESKRKFAIMITAKKEE